ncbi:hypothetical protein CYLTODRAFT_457766 [Cylindrobasidium torrendii FP15055 ss-10]|uniref:Uncharacterized protein n=1 Tax=Cylindrobasidium torrendii FP15055 ss-10 TaxID=1314674 RepID=A0A0D7B048_9AGAR|nr:hypothetical protein CYLTODRAFT_457766 [Cylindrobasidium torrendii FP15055 ss-10]
MAAIAIRTIPPRDAEDVSFTLEFFKVHARSGHSLELMYGSSPTFHVERLMKFVNHAVGSEPDHDTSRHHQSLQSRYFDYLRPSIRHPTGLPPESSTVACPLQIRHPATGGMSKRSPMPSSSWLLLILAHSHANVLIDTSPASPSPITSDTTKFLAEDSFDCKDLPRFPRPSLMRNTACSSVLSDFFPRFFAHCADIFARPPCRRTIAEWRKRDFRLSLKVARRPTSLNTTVMLHFVLAWLDGQSAAGEGSVSGNRLYLALGGLPDVATLGDVLDLSCRIPQCGIYLTEWFDEPSRKLDRRPLIRHLIAGVVSEHRIPHVLLFKFQLTFNPGSSPHKRPHKHGSLTVASNEDQQCSHEHPFGLERCFSVGMPVPHELYLDLNLNLDLWSLSKISLPVNSRSS